MDLVDRLQEEIDKKGISKIELARISGVKRSTIYNVFNKNYDAKLETIRQISKALNVSMDYLITGRSFLSGNSIMILYNALPDKKKLAAEAYIRGLLEADNISADTLLKKAL